MLPLGEAAVGGLVRPRRGEAASVEQREAVVAQLADDAHLVAVLEVRADAGQVDAHRMPCASSSSRGPMPESISSCGVLNAPPARITSRRTSARFAAGSVSARSAGAGRPRRRAERRGTRPRRRASRSSKTTFVTSACVCDDEVPVRLGRGVLRCARGCRSGGRWRVASGTSHRPAQAAVRRPASRSGRARCAGSGGSPRCARAPRQRFAARPGSRTGSRRAAPGRAARRWRRAGSSSSQPP